MKNSKPTAITPEKALQRLQTLCAKSEQCCADLRVKLVKWKISQSDSEMILSELIEARFVDDERFAHAYCYDKFTFSGWGRRKIAIGLQAKRIDRAVAQETLADIDPREYAAMARRLIKARAESIGDAAATREGRTKLLNFGVSRGFEPDLIMKIIRKLGRGDDECE